MVVQQEPETVKVYGEEQFDRKLKLERLRWPVLGEDAPSEEHCRLVEACHLSDVARVARFTPLERKVFTLVARGASIGQVAQVLGLSPQRANFACCKVRRKLRRTRNDRYSGLYEVYWSEVRRYVYRKPGRARGVGNRRLTGVADAENAEE